MSPVQMSPTGWDQTSLTSLELQSNSSPIGHSIWPQEHCYHGYQRGGVSFHVLFPDNHVHGWTDVSIT